MKKVLLRLYLKENLGDDLFGYIILNRYKNNFYIYNQSNYTPFQKFDNVFFCSNKIELLYNKLMQKLFNIIDYRETKVKKKYDLLLYAGGSIFIEHNNIKYWQQNVKQYKRNYVSYVIIGCNVGPYEDSVFPKLLYNNVFSCADDVCFRDKKSYSLYKGKKNIRYAEDIVFSLDSNKVRSNLKNTIVISIIDTNYKFDSSVTSSYEKVILNIINYYKDKGNKITLMSFCKKEGDETAINRIVNQLTDTTDIEKYFYRGNIDESLSIIKSAKLIVGSRFHANILGLLFGKRIIPISYSSKLDNVLKDIDYQGTIIRLNELEKINIVSVLEENYQYDIKKLNKIIKNSNLQFQYLDKILERRS